MPLMDHFRKPVEIRAPWSSVGTVWVSRLMKSLNKVLPRDRYVALGTTHLGSQAEADISEFEIKDFSADKVQTALATKPLPAPTATIEATFPEADEYAVHVKDLREGMKLVAVIEFVSEANKDREESRIQFVQKCLAYLKLGIGLAIVDVVTTRGANLHNDILQEMQTDEVGVLAETHTYVSSYHPWLDHEKPRLDVWAYLAQIGAAIPSVPLALKGGPIVMLPLDECYLETLDDHNLIDPPL
jgi:hypothetical protein